MKILLAVMQLTVLITRFKIQALGFAKCLLIIGLIKIRREDFNSI